LIAGIGSGILLLGLGWECLPVVRLIKDWSGWGQLRVVLPG